MTEASTPVEIFCCYSHVDEMWLRKLETHLSLLKRQGLISLWYDRLIVLGTDWAHAIDTHLETASVILLLVSADFLASDYCYGIEMKCAVARQEAGESRVIPILVRPADWRSAPFAHLQTLPLDAKPLSTWQDKDAALTDVAIGIRRVIVEELPHPPARVPRAAFPAIWNIPYPRNPFFSGREDLLLLIHTELQRGQPMAVSQRPQALSGLGGIGKTQIAVEYAYRFGQEYQAVLWAQAESTAVLISSCVTFATLLGLPEQHTQEHIIAVRAIKRWLQNHREWLLILDNADELALVPQFLPPTLGGHLLLTTRAQALARLANRIEVETFSAEQGALLLLRRAGLLPHDATLPQAPSDDRERALQITRTLQGLPLALDQAGAYLEEIGCSLSEYQQLYQQHQADLLRERRGSGDDHPPVATIWSLAFQKVEEKNPAAGDLLRLCAFLQPDAIPEEIVLEGGEHLGSRLQTLATNPLAFHEAIGLLRTYSLLQREAREHLLSIHRLVQVVLQDAMDGHERTLWRARVIRALNAILPKMNYATWRRGLRLVPHVLICAAEMGEQEEIPELATVLEKAATYLREQGHYEQAEPLYQRALHILERAQGPESTNVAQSLVKLATLYLRQGKDEQGELLYQRALHIWEQAQGPESADVVWSLTELATLYREQGHYEQAEPLYQRALHIWEQAQVPESTDVAWSFVMLADLYQEQGHYEQAEPLYQRALHIWEQRVTADSNDASAYFVRGYLYLYLKKRDLACADFTRYAALQPENVNAAWMAVYTAFGKQHPEIEISERLEKIAKLNPQRSEAYVCRGVALGLRGKLQEGLTELEHAIHLNGHNADAWFWRGLMYAFLTHSWVTVRQRRSP